MTHRLPGPALVIAIFSTACTGGDPDRAIDTVAQAVSGERLFADATFLGNGRRCATCHRASNAFTISPELVRALYAADPDDALFRAIDSDDGVGESYARLLTHATIRVALPLPPTVRLHDDPTATMATVHRGIPSILNVALEPVLMADGREPSLPAQAAGAIAAHFEPGTEPTAKELDKIASYESHQFSSVALGAAAGGGPDPGLPPGTTASEIRGRKFFVAEGRCGQCHSGPLLDETSDRNPNQPPGVRFEFIFAGFPEFLGGPSPATAEAIRTWDFECPAGGSFICDVAAPAFGFPIVDGWVSLPARDPGRGLVTGNPDDAYAFKITTLRNVRATAPYFHDNSAATLEEVVAHYDLFFSAFEGLGLTPEEQADIVAYMELL